MGSAVAVLQRAADSADRTLSLALLQKNADKRSSAGAAVAQLVIINGIDVRPSGNMPTWEQGGETYHINLTTETYHVTKEGVPKVHYFFEGSGEEIEDKQPTEAERGSKKKVKGKKGKVKTSTVFSALPENVQNFVRGHWSSILAVR